MFKATIAALWLGAGLLVQDPGTTKASLGVYTDVQADRGKTAFATYCTGCHTVASQSGEGFSKKWNGATAADLYKVLTEEMPKDDPGALEPKERADVLAYLLKINGLAAGTTELPPDPEPLKRIVLDIVK